MPGPRCVKFLVNQMFPEYPLIIDTVIEHDAKRRYNECQTMVIAFNHIQEERLQRVASEFYTEFVDDKSFIHLYGLHFPEVFEDMLEEMKDVACDILLSLTTSMTREEYIGYILSCIATGVWSREIAYKIMKSQLFGLRMMREQLTNIQDEVGLSYGPLI